MVILPAFQQTRNILSQFAILSACHKSGNVQADYNMLEPKGNVCCILDEIVLNGRNLHIREKNISIVVDLMASRSSL
jgi:hypothetical protein